MPLEDQDILRRLILAKNFHSRAENNLKNGDAIGRMVAMHHFHISIEIVLRALLSHFSITVNENIGFDELLGALRGSDHFKNGDKRVPYHQQIKIINKRRNDVQHNASEPSEQNVQEAQVFSRRFLIESYNSFFDLDFESLSDFGFIKNELLRRYMEVSNTLFEAGLNQRAFGVARAAFEWAQCYIDHLNVDHFSEFDIDHLKGNIETSGYDNHENYLLLKELEKLDLQTKANTKRIRLLSSGLDMTEYSNYLNYRPAVALSMGGSVWIPPDHPFTGDAEITQSAIRFVTTTILNWQRLGDGQKLNGIASESNTFLDEELQAITQRP